ncbi:putative amidase [Colletotrichum sp. SAR 10_70]|nr:putative amidase [Colletotrichum sp. SAR 10_70]KAI8204250.1 putative amidase [Colletotrichum sp. SAR 10_76]
MTALNNAPVVEKLLHAGLVIIGKGNMTEFCGLKCLICPLMIPSAADGRRSNDTPVGWSAFGGQTKSPYRRDGLSEDEQPRASWKDAVDRMRGAGARVVYPIELPAYDTVIHDKQTLHTIAYHEFSSQVKKFAGNFDPETGDIKTLEDVVAWNKDHADEALPPQLEAALVAATAMTEAEHQAAVSEVRRLSGIDGLGRAMREAQVDVIVSASDSIAVGFAGAAGWPIATVPLGNLETNGQPFGLFVTAPEGREDLLFRFMGAFYATFQAIEKPAQL